MNEEETGGHRTIYLALIAAVAIIAGGYILTHFAYSGSQSSSETPQAPLEAVSGQASDLPANNATGTADWRQQIQALVPGSIATTSSSGNSSGTGNTVTDKLSENIYNVYLGLQQASQSGGSTSAVPTLDQFTAQNKATITAPQYTESKFTVVPDSSSALRDYALRIASTFSTYIPSSQDNELQLIEKAGQTQDPQLVATLTSRAAGYRAAVQAFISMSVPRSAVSLHVQITNTLSFLAASVSAMAQLYTDPLTALAGIKKFQESATQFAQEGAALGAYFQQMSSKFGS